MTDSSTNSTPSSAAPAAAPASPAKLAAAKAPTLLDAETHGLSSADKAAFHARKAEMGAAARREARNLMIGIFISFGVLVAVAAVWQVVNPRHIALTVALLVVLAADLGFLGYITFIIWKHWKQGTQAQARHKERLAAIQAARAASQPAAKKAADAKNQALAAEKGPGAAK